MATQRFLATAAAVGALAFAAPVLAHEAAGHDAPHSAPEAPVVFQSEPMVQPLPGAVSAPAPLPAGPAEPTWTEKPHHPHAAVPPVSEHHGPHGHAAMPRHPMAAYPGYAPMAPQFDREAWLGECRERIRGVDRKDRGGVIGGLLGAIAGGVAGNRLWDSKRFAGTLLGAGVGGLAGAAIGSAIAASGDRDRIRDDECADYLDRYMAGGYGGHGYGYPGYGYGYAHAYPAYAYVPVMVQVPQRAIVHETVTEEWITEPVRSRTIAPTKTIRYSAPAPAPTKRTKLFKGR